MKAIKEILDFPWMTEKSTAIRAASNQYVFKVKPSANKIEIKQAPSPRPLPEGDHAAKGGNPKPQAAKFQKIENTEMP